MRGVWLVLAVVLVGTTLAACGGDDSSDNIDWNSPNWSTYVINTGGTPDPDWEPPAFDESRGGITWPTTPESNPAKRGEFTLGPSEHEWARRLRLHY